ncbi:hypothetical protein BJV78DRAFT_1281597 [Lactifluus subvellereus]|nr:hypothetical protein BJV78DRAFT_1281597 [Lactifluus subvellereus]
MFLNFQPAAYAHLVKLVHVFAGVYVWEYITNLDFEWEIYTGRRRWRWSFVVYLLARVLALASLTTLLVGFDIKTSYNCDAWFNVVIATSWFSNVFASLLLVLRGVALWARSGRITALSSAAWLTNFGGSLYAATKGHSRWSTATENCILTGPSDFRWPILINFIQDLTLLCIMFSGVLHKRAATRLWKMLYIQALWWILAWIITEVPSVILSFRSVDEDWNLFVSTVLYRHRRDQPSFIGVLYSDTHAEHSVITASRAYRVLFQYITDDRDTRPPPLRRFRNCHNNNATPRIFYHGRDVQVTVHRTIECDMELPRPPPCQLPKHSPSPPQMSARGATIVLKGVRHAASSGSSAADSNSGCSKSGAVSPV